MFKAKLCEINEFGGICAAKFKTEFDTEFTMVSLEFPSNLTLEMSAKLGFKSSDVILSTEKLNSCSLSNEIKANIENIETGEILSVVKLKNLQGGEIFEGIITTNSAKRLNLEPNSQIYAYIKATSIFIDEIL